MSALEPESARELYQALSRQEPSPRVSFMKRQVESLLARHDVAAGERLSFDEESLRLYGVVAALPDLEEAARIRVELDAILPKGGSLLERFAAFQRAFLVPRDRLERVLSRAIEECRRRTREHLELPDEEGIALELVSGKDWPAFSTYQGGFRSVVRVNLDFPVPLGRVVEIAAHETYPGHHTASVLRDRELVVEKGLLELSVEPLVGPDALVREDLAASAWELAFSEEERLDFERDALYPLAGIDPSDAARHAEVERLVDRLEPLLVDAARRYLDGERDRVATAIWLENEAVVVDPWTFLRFVDRNRTYVVTYTSGPSVSSWASFTSLLLVSPDDPT
jgi:hypothetical protein